MVLEYRMNLSLFTAQIVNALDQRSTISYKHIRCVYNHMIVQVLQVMQIRENACPQSASERIQKDTITTLIT